MPTESPTIFQKSLDQLGVGKDLTRKTASRAMSELLVSPDISDAQIAAFIMGLKTKGEQVAEVAGILDALISAGDKVGVENPQDLLDTCGTGGDKQNTFNISTLAALVAASGDVKVVKHGNSFSTSASGSADVLSAVGVNIHLSPTGVASCVQKTGFGFCFARYFHQSFGRVSAIRRQLGLRTIFNVLGPLSNPANVGRQLVGVDDPELLDLVADVLIERGTKRALVVCGLGHNGGMDEISTLGKTKAIEIKEGKKTEYDIDPKKIGIKTPEIKDLLVMSLQDATKAANEVLTSTKEGPKVDIVALNAGAALYISEKAKSIKEGYELAKTLLLEQKTAEKLKEVIEESNKLKRHPAAPKEPEFNIEQLKKMLDTAFQISKKLPQADIPPQLTPILKFQHLTSELGPKMYDLIMENPQYRARLFEKGKEFINPEKLKNDPGYFWLFRPVGWEAEISRLTKEAEIGETEVLQAELAKMQKLLQKLEKGSEKLQKEIHTLKEKAEHNINKLRSEKTELSKTAKEQEKNLVALRKNFERERYENIQNHAEAMRLQRELEDQAEQLHRRKAPEAELLELLQSSDINTQAEEKVKQIKDLYDVKPAKLPKKPLPYPDGMLSTNNKAAEALMRYEVAYLVVDGYNVVFSTSNGVATSKLQASIEGEISVEAERDLKQSRDTLSQFVTNIIDTYPIEHAYIFWDSVSSRTTNFAQKSSFGHRVSNKFVEDADDAIVKFSADISQPVIVVTEDKNLRERLAVHRVNYLSHEQFEYLKNKASGTA